MSTSQKYQFIKELKTLIKSIENDTVSAAFICAFDKNRENAWSRTKDCDAPALEAMKTIINVELDERRHKRFHRANAEARLVEKIKADLEIGAPGRLERRKRTLRGVPLPHEHYSLVSSQTGMEVGIVWEEVDVRRMERLPTLEAAFIQHVEEIAGLKRNEKFLRDCLSDRGMSATRHFSN